MVYSSESTDSHVPNIVVEGVDGSGKTTLAQRLALDLDSKYVDPQRSLMLGKESADKQGGAARVEFYQTLNRVTSEVMRAMVGHVVIDKYQLSTVAFGRTTGQAVEWRDGLWQPDATIYLRVDPAARNSRLDARQEKLRHQYEVAALLDRAAYEYEELIAERQTAGDKIITINTTELAPEATLQAVYKELGLYAAGN